MPAEFLVMTAIALVLTLLAVIFLVPGEQTKKRKRRSLPAESSPSQEQKDWQEKALRLEKHIRFLRGEILTLEKSGKDQEKVLMVELARVKKLQEKLSQERDWHKKEQDSIDRKGKEFQALKADLAAAQESFSKEHAANIRLEHQVKDLKREGDGLNEQRRAAEREAADLKAKIDVSRKEITRLTKENIRLAQAKEDTQWVAKAEYDRVNQLLSEKEKELSRVNRDLKSQGGDCA